MISLLSAILLCMGNFILPTGMTTASRFLRQRIFCNGYYYLYITEKEDHIYKRVCNVLQTIHTLKSPACILNQRKLSFQKYYKWVKICVFCSQLIKIPCAFSLLPATHLYSIISFSVETMLLFLFLAKREQKQFLEEQKYTVKNVGAHRSGFVPP